MLDQALFKRVHIIGIGGAGMSAIARILLESGSTVSGSDRQATDITRSLVGATIYEGHDSANIVNSQPGVVLISSAVKDDNPEVVMARAGGIPVLTRREAFRYLLPSKTQIAVAGTHGKTTTTALIVHLLRETGHDPSYIVGGVMLNTGTNAHVGTGDTFVIEADEYGDMFLGLTPKIAVLTNIEHDHPDIFPTIDDVMNKFREFVALIPHNGTLIACADDPNALRLATERKSAGKPVQTYTIDGEHTLTEFLSPVLIGDHNYRNVLAAVLALRTYGVGHLNLLFHIKNFKGTARRFEIMGELGGVTVVSDYGHHPTAIRATLEAVKVRYHGKSIWAVWQPHTYSRTKLLADQFAGAFGDANHVLITDIYAAREQPIPGTPSTRQLATMMTAAGHPDARHSGTLEATAAILRRETRSGDVVIIFSAGDAPKIGEILLKG